MIRKGDHKNCPDCQATRAKMYSTSEEQSGAPERKSDKRRSFLQQPKSYVSKLQAPTTYSNIPAVPRPTETNIQSTVEASPPKTQPIAIPQTSPQGQNSFPEQIEPQEFFIGDRVSIGGVKTGTLLYFGPTHIAAGLWCGISLDEPEGIHDGLVNDVRYFTCRKGHGIFAPVERVSHLDHKVLKTIIKSSPKVSQIPNKTQVCRTSPLSDEISFSDRSSELIDVQDIEDDILGLDENGIIHDDDYEPEISRSNKPKRKLPKLPRPASHGRSRLQYMRRDFIGGQRVDEEIMDETDKLQVVTSSDEGEEIVEGNHTFNIDEKYDAVVEHPHSAGGSSGGEDSWSLSKDYLTMCDGKAQYLNITFDGESESKNSTQEPSEESPSPEFIFDQEMIEDGEFATEPIEMSQPMEMSRDSSMGLISSFVLDKNDLLTELFGEEDEDDLVTSQGTLEATSEDNRDTSPEKTPERQEDFDTSVDLDDGDIDLVTSTPLVENINRNNVRKNLNETYTQEGDDNVDFSKAVVGKLCLNSTYTQETEHVTSSQYDTGFKPNLNGTFTLEGKTEAIVNSEVSAIATKDDIPGKGPMVDSGISMGGSMSKSGNSLLESGISMKGSLVDPSIRRSMLDSGITAQQSAMIESNHMVQKVISANKDPTKDTECEDKMSVEYKDGSVQKVVGFSENVVHSQMDDKKLIKDLCDGHQRKERPISFLSTTSADTGYIPDTDSEIGTLTLNSPQDWTDRGFHSNHAEQAVTTAPVVQKTVISDFQDENGRRLVPAAVESDSDLGTMTGDTDTEADRLELLKSESITLETPRSTEGVAMETLSEDAGESEDEITQVEDTKGLNTTATLETNKQNATFTADTDKDTADLNSTFPVNTDGDTGVSTDADNVMDDENTNNSNDATDSEAPLVTIVIADKVEETEKDKAEKEGKNGDKKLEKKKAPKKKFNVVKDFKKPNTTNVVSKLSEYLKTPVPVKPREDKVNTEEAKNKRNSLKGKIDLSKVTSKINNKSPIDEQKKVNGETDKKEVENAEKEKEKEIPKKLIKRTPPKSKWDAIMSKIEVSKDVEKPKSEIKSKIEAFSHIPPPAPPKKEEPKPKKKISSALPDFSKVQSKLKYTAPPATPKAKKEESPNSTKTPTRKNSDSPNPSKTESPSRSVTNSPKRKINTSKSSSPSRAKSESVKRRDSTKDVSPSRSKETVHRGRERPLSKGLKIKNERVRSLSGDSSVKRPDIKDKAVHIDLADSLDGRGSRVGTGSLLSSCQSSRTDMSTTEDENIAADSAVKQHPGIERTLSLQERRDSSSVVSDFSYISEAGSQEMAREIELQLQKAVASQQRRKSSLVQPTNSVDSSSSGGEGGDTWRRQAGPRIVKPVLRQRSAPSPLTICSSQANKPPSMFTNKAPSGKTASKRSRNQNRNKTSKSKKEPKEKIKPPETVLAEVHTQEVHRLEALCETRTKQLNMVKMQLQTSNLAFDGMAKTVDYLAHDLDAFSCPCLVKTTKSLEQDLVAGKSRITTLEEQKVELEDIIANMKEQHKDYVNNLEAENDRSLQYQRESLTIEHDDNLNEMKARKAAEISQIRNAHENYIARMQSEQDAALEKLRTEHGEAIRQLQRKQENQMEELHKQHQDKLEDITGRFDSIKLTLSEKVETLRSECDRLRDRARSCEDALQRDSDFKVQCALAPYKNLPQEIESLKTVLEMRNEEINKLRSQNTDLQKKLEELPIAQEKIIGLVQKKENLEAIISMKTDHEKVLHERCQSLMRKYDKESRANKRLSMEYEEMMWKLSETLNESDLGSQEAEFYQKLGISPNSTGEMGSPLLGRKLRTPSSSDSSPSKSPGYRRTLSSSADDREEKKLKRRSGNFLLDERKQHQQRPTSPLAKNNNPLTKSWSPGTSTQSSLPIRTNGQSGTKMSQSWCVDMEVTDAPEDVEKIPRSRSVSGKPSNRNSKLVTKDVDSENSDSDKGFVSTNESCNSNSQGLNDSSELCESLKSNGVSYNSDNFAVSSTPRSGRETVTLMEEANVFTDKDGDKNVVHEVKTTELNGSNSNIPADQSWSSNNVSLATETVTCPTTKLPDSPPKRRQTETTV